MSKDILCDLFEKELVEFCHGRGIKPKWLKSAAGQAFIRSTREGVVRKLSDTILAEMTHQHREGKR